MRFLLDSNVLIEHLNGAPTWEPLFEAFRQDKIFLSVSVISRFEIFSFTRLTNEDESNAMLLFNALYVYTVDERIADAAALLRRKFKRGRADLIVAATALTNELPLITRDRHGFKNIEGLTLYTDPSFLS